MKHRGVALCDKCIYGMVQSLIINNLKMSAFQSIEIYKILNSIK